MARYIDVKTLKSLIRDDDEIALLDVREAGQFGFDHMLHAVPCPYSLLETRARVLVPRTSVRMVLIDGGDVIVHLFRPEVREFYNLEKIWASDNAHRAPAN